MLGRQGLTCHLAWDYRGRRSWFNGFVFSLLFGRRRSFLLSPFVALNEGDKGVKVHLLHLFRILS